MSCPTCNDNSPLSFDVQSFINTTCLSSTDACVPSKKICYTGGNLICSGILTNDDLEIALTKLDSKICAIAGNYSTYQKNCLPTWFGSVINTEGVFVNAITSYACNIATNLQTFTGTTFPQYQTSVTAQISAITGPSLVCAAAGATIADNLYTILGKYCTLLSTIKTDLNLSDVNFGNCFTVTQPLTVHQGFVSVLDQICQVKVLAQGISTLPIFNNVGSCLATPLTTDTLVATIDKIKTRLCLTPTYNSAAVGWGCGTPEETSLESGLGYLANSLTNVLYNFPSFGSGFTVADKTPGTPCAGKLITLNPLVDRFVAATTSDATPGTLASKLIGDGITIDSTVPTQITLRNTYKLLSSSADITPDYLANKLGASSINGISITPTYNVATKKVDLLLGIDKNLLCELVNSCVNPVCSNYLITPLSPGANVSYYTCDGIVQYVTISAATNICAKINTPYCATATIQNVGQCTSLASSRFVFTNSVSQATITSVKQSGVNFVTPIFNSFPLGATIPSVLIGTGTTSNAVTVAITMSAPLSCNLTLSKNNIIQQTLPVLNTGSYIFTALTFLPGDEMTFNLSSTA